MKLLDTFMAFLVAVGVLQFVYCLIGGNYVSRFCQNNCRNGFTRDVIGLVLLITMVNGQPFNAFLSGFSATVGQFVLTASLRLQTNPENKGDFEKISNERYVYNQRHSAFTTRPAQG